MTGQTNDWLYTLSTSTGQATRVGSAGNFSIGETAPGGIAAGYTRPAGFAVDAAGNVSYSAGAIEPGVYTLYARARDSKSAANAPDTANDDTALVTVTVPNLKPAFDANSYSFNLLPGTDGSSQAVTVGTAAATDPAGHGLTFTLRGDDPSDRLYFVGGATDALFRLDPSDSSVVRVGAASQFGAQIGDPLGMTWHNGKLYMVAGAGAGSALYTVDTVTGVAARVALTQRLTGSVATASGLASYGGDLYMTAAAVSGKLFRVDLDSLSATQIGSDNLGVSETKPRGMALLGGKLYLLGATTAALYELNSSTGAASQVGSATSFGSVNETAPLGLAALGADLYMTGGANDWLYRLDTGTGTGTRVGSVSQFGVSETVPAGLAGRYIKPADFSITAGGVIRYSGAAASAGDAYTVYARITDGINSKGAASPAIDDHATVSVRVVNEGPEFDKDAYRFTLTPGSDGSSDPVSVGTVAAPDPDSDDTVAYGLRASDASTRMYLVQDAAGVGADALYTVDSSTGAATRASNVLNFGLGTANVGAAGLAWHDGRLYMASADTAALYIVDTTTGAASRVGTATSFGVSESSPSGLASHNGALYMIGHSTHKLYTIDSSSGVATAVSSTTANFGGASAQNRGGLASVGGTLYTINSAADHLESLNTTTGAASQVGSSTAFGVSETQPGALAAHGGSLYMAGNLNSTLYTLDTTTGAATSVGAFGSAVTAATGLATGYSQPADFAIGSSTGAITYTGASAPAGLLTLYATASDSKASDGTADTAVDDSRAGDAGRRQPATVVRRCRSTPSLLPHRATEAVTPVAVGTISASDPDSDTLAYSLRSSDAATRMYSVQDATGTDDDALFSLDSSTGAASRVGGAVNFGAGTAIGPVGLAWHDGRLYMAGADTDALYTVDTDSGRASRVGTATAFGVGETDPAGLASHNGRLYLLGNETAKLYTLEVATGTASAVSATTADFGSVTAADRSGLASHSGTLYMLNVSGGYLETVNAATGAAARVGASAQFGVSESAPADLASHASKLYLVGDATDTLYTLNTTTGAATSVGALGASSSPSGVSSGYPQPAGFTVDASTGAITYTGASAPIGIFTLYAQVHDGKAADGTSSSAVDATAAVTVSSANNEPAFSAESYSFGLFPGSDGSVNAVALGAVSATDADASDTLTYSLRSSDAATQMYLAQDASGTASDGLYSLDSSTGAAARVGNAVNFGLGATAAGPSGLAWHNGRLYMAGGDSASLYVVDERDGTASRVGVAYEFGAREGQPAGLASHNGKLYMVGNDDYRLYTVDTASGIATAVAASTSNFGGTAQSRFGLASDGTSLYTLNSVGDYLERLDPTTGAATRIGSATAFDVSETAASELAYHGSKLYMVGTGNRTLYELNTSTGAATSVAGLSGGVTSPFGLASGYSQPAGYAIDSSSGALTYTGASAPAGDFTLYAHVTDSTGPDGRSDSSADDTATVTIVSANRPTAFSARSYEFTLSDDADGSTTPVSLGTLTATDPEGDTVYYSLRPSDTSETVYITGSTADALYSFDRTISANSKPAVRVAAVTGFGVSETDPSGMAWHRGELYMVGRATDSLYTVDITTGTAALVATASQLLNNKANTALSGVASHNGALYVSTVMTGGLYRVEIDTLTAAQVGADNFGAVGESQAADIASHSNSLYMIGDHHDRLYTINASTGAATAVNLSATRFGTVGESQPRGLESYGGKLYLIGRSNNKLFELDTTTGTASATSHRINFGAGELEGAGIARGYTRPSNFAIDAANGLLTFTGSTPAAGVYTLYAQARDDKAPDNTPAATIDDIVAVIVTVPAHKPQFSAESYSFKMAPGTDGSQNAVTVGTADATDEARHTLTYSLRASDPSDRLYLVGTDSDALYTVDSDDSTARRVGLAVEFGAGIKAPAGVAWHDGKLYMIAATSSDSALYTLNSDDGTASPLATISHLTGSSDTGTGIASHSGDLYIVTEGTGRLFKVDLDELEATEVGSAGIGAVGETQPRGLASHAGKLYTVGSGTDFLYELNPATGAATGVGVSSAFGSVNETDPYGLVSHDGTLYMTGRANDWLYTVNTATGAATRVGTLARFGVSEGSPAGVASAYRKPAAFSIAANGDIKYSGSAALAGDRFTLYARVSDGVDSIGGSNPAIDDRAVVTVDVANSGASFTQDEYSFSLLPGSDGSTTPIALGSVAATDPDTADTLSFSLRPSDTSTHMYALQDASGSGGDALYRVDASSGTASRVGRAFNFGLGTTDLGPSALAWHLGKLYMAGSATGRLYAVDFDNATASRIGTLDGFGVNEGTPTGLASHAGRLYMIGTDTDKLYTVNPATGAAAAVSASTADFGGSTEQARSGLASHGNKLYTLNIAGDYLEELDTATGAATRIGASTSFGVSEGSPGSLASHSGSLLFAGADTDKLYSLDTTTGAATEVASLSDALSSPGGLETGYTQPSGYQIAAANGAVTYTASSAPAGTFTLYAQVTDSKADDGTASTAIDDRAAVTVLSANRGPTFSADTYTFSLEEGSNGTVNAVTVGTVRATDPDRDAVAYDLRVSDASTVMYLVGDSQDALYALDSTTGTAARVGDAKAFGVAETSPRGMAWHNGELYMIGAQTDSLYKLDIVTGTATLVASRRQITGTASGLTLSGVASHGGELYVSTVGIGRVYAVDLETSRGVQIGGDGFASASESHPVALASHSGSLYMAGAGNDRLYTLNTTTGAASAVGASTSFATSPAEGSPTGLASHGTTLYMTGAGNDWLYSLNTTTGAATRIGAATAFAVGETSPGGIAGGYVAPADFSIDSAAGSVSYTGASAAAGVHTLYARARDNKAADGSAEASIDDTARVAVVVEAHAPEFGADAYEFFLPPGADGSVNAVTVGTASASDDAGHTLTYSLTDSDAADRMYFIGSANDALYALDSDDSNAVRIGRAHKFGVGLETANSLTWHDGKLYMVGGGFARGALYTVDPRTGEATRVATMKQLHSSLNPSGLASHAGELYMVSRVPGRLHRIDLDTLSAATIGSINFGSAVEWSPHGLASHGGKLYMIGARNDRLYVLDPATGAATAVGSETSFGTANETDPTGLASHGSSLYMVGGANGWLYTLDTSTGTATRVGAVTGFGVSETAPAGIASGYVKPADFSIGADGVVKYSGAAATAGTVFGLYAQVSDGLDSRGNASSAADDFAQVTVIVANSPPSFAKDSYDFSVIPGTNGSVTASTVGTVTANDSDTADTVGYSLRASDPSTLAYVTLHSPAARDAALYSVNTLTGAAARVGDAYRWGIPFGETQIRMYALAWHNGKLYGLGQYPVGRGMFVINVDTGRAEPLGNARFGINEHLPSGLASHNGKLYMIGRQTHKLYTVDTETGAATAVSDSTVNFGHDTAQERFGLASHNGKLYTLNDGGEYLETIDATTGSTTRVGASNRFGVNERTARDLTVHSGALYMVGRGNDTLYTLNTTTGAATSAVRLDISISDPVGIATGYARPADYAIGSASGAITYTGSSAPVGEFTLYAQASDGKSRTSTADSAVDDTTQVTVRIANRAPSFTAGSYAFTLATRSNGSVSPVSVGTAAGADPDSGDTVAYSFRDSDTATRMYVVQDANLTDLDSLYSVDSSTGTAARVGDAANFRLSSGNAAPTGLTWHNGKLYFAGYDTGRLYVVDATTGEGELAGTSANFGVGENKPTGLASHGGMLYLIGETTDKLYTLDPATGVATAVSSSTVDFGGSTEQARRGLASHGGALYTLNDGGNWLETLNTSTGAATRVGASTSFGVNETSPRGLASHGGSLYMVGAGTDTLYTLNTTTGAATSVGTLGNAVTDPTGLASGYVKPSDFAVNSTTGAVTYTGSSAVAGQYTLYAQLSDSKGPDGTASTVVDDFAAVTVTVVGTPAAATNLAAASDHQSSVLTASITDDGGSPVTRWEYVQKLAVGGSYPNTWTQISSSASNTLSHTVTDLTNGTSYTFKVRAVNSSGASADSNESTVTPQANAPAAATNLTATASNTSVTLAASITDDGGSTVTRWEYCAQEHCRRQLPQHLDHHRRQRVEFLEFQGDRPHQRHQLHVQGARREQHRRRR